MLADAVMEGCNNKKSWYTTVTSAARNAKRMKSVCTPFAAVPLWANIRSSLPAETEIITVSHSARSREIFAVGALNAALFMVGKPSGIYNMGDLIGKC